MTCAVCQKHESWAGLPGGVIFQDDKIFVAHFPWIESEPPPHRGHIIIEMKRHITSPSELLENEAAAVGVMMAKLSAGLENLGNEHVYFFRIGDITKHLHFHLVPRPPGIPRELWGTSLYQQPTGPKATPADIQTISNQLRQSLKA